MKKTAFSLMAGLLLSLSAAQTVLAQEVGLMTRATVVSPEVTSSQVIFRLRAPEAQNVRVSATWLQDPGKGAMTKDDQGVWTLAIPKPSPELYTYNFIVDGVSILDPVNVSVQRDGNRYTNALLLEGDYADLYKQCEKPGNLEQMWYYSQENDMTRRLYVYTPYGYDRNDKSKKYPVLYLLHGGGGDEDAWATLGRTCQILDNLILQGKATPMIVVMPNGNPNQYAAQTLQIPVNPNTRQYASGFDNYSSLTTDIMPFIDKTYNTIASKEGRSVAGLSMGGGQAYYIGFRNVNLFSSVGVFSSGLIGATTGGPFDAEKQVPGMISRPGDFNKFDVIFLSCGEEDNRIDGMKEFDSLLRQKGYKGVTWQQVPGGHEWKVWRRNLSAYVQLIFKK